MPPFSSKSFLNFSLQSKVKCKLAANDQKSCLVVLPAVAFERVKKINTIDGRRKPSARGEASHCVCVWKLQICVVWLSVCVFCLCCVLLFEIVVHMRKRKILSQFRRVHNKTIRVAYSYQTSRDTLSNNNNIARKYGPWIAFVYALSHYHVVFSRFG